MLAVPLTHWYAKICFAPSPDEIQADPTVRLRAASGECGTSQQDMAREPKTMASRRRSTQRARSQRPAAAGGSRTLLHLPLSQAVVDDVDTLLWLRVTAAQQSVEAIRGGKNHIYDESVERFIQRYRNKPCPTRMAERTRHPWRTLWVRTSLVKRCRTIAERENVAMGRVVAFALTCFISDVVTPRRRRFRHKTGERAHGLLSSPP